MKENHITKIFVIFIKIILMLCIRNKLILIFFTVGFIWRLGRTTDSIPYKKYTAISYKTLLHEDAL